MISAVRFTLLFFTVLAPLGCCWNCPAPAYSSVTSYKIRSNAITLRGVRVDTGGYSVDLVKLDARLDAIEACVLRVAPLVTPEQARAGGCLSESLRVTPLRRCCFIVKVVPPIKGCSKDWQFIDALAPDASCLAKGITPTPACPCRWRTTVQNNMVTVTPPAMYLWEVIRWWTSCNNLWVTPLAQCAGKGFGYE